MTTIYKIQREDTKEIYPEKYIGMSIAEFKKQEIMDFLATKGEFPHLVVIPEREENQ